MNSALISDCGHYRYLLTRGEEPRLAFIMLNPSTADAEDDDPTIRRCMAFAKREGANGIEVANLYALRATNPRALWKAAHPVGPENDRHLRDFAFRHRIIVCAWGANAQAGRASDVMRLLRDGFAPMLMCLGRTKARQPKHPLYLPADAALEPLR